MLRAKIGKGIVIVLVFLLAFVLIFLPAIFFDTGIPLQAISIEF